MGSCLNSLKVDIEGYSVDKGPFIKTDRLLTRCKPGFGEAPVHTYLSILHTLLYYEISWICQHQVIQSDLFIPCLEVSRVTYASQKGMQRNCQVHDIMNMNIQLQIDGWKTITSITFPFLGKPGCSSWMLLQQKPTKACREEKNHEPFAESAKWIPHVFQLL